MNKETSFFFSSGAVITCTDFKLDDPLPNGVFESFLKIICESDCAHGESQIENYSLVEQRITIKFPFQACAVSK